MNIFPNSTDGKAPSCTPLHVHPIVRPLWKNLRKIFLPTAALALCSTCAIAGEASLRLANVFGPSMVLQREMPVPVWGWADPQSEITVSFKDQKKTGHADADGRWQIVLEPMPADGKPQTLQVTSAGAEVKADNILVGDVWICAGPGYQRNIGAVGNAKEEIAKAKFPQVRILRPDMYKSSVPVADIPLPASWVAVSPETIGEYAITWYFARELHAASGVPVGLILANNNSAGQVRDWFAWNYDPQDKAQDAALHNLAEKLPQDMSRVRNWLFQQQRRKPSDPDSLLLFPSYINYELYGTNPNFDGPYPITGNSSGYNAGIYPLLPMAVRGVVFQSEFDAKSFTAPEDLSKVVTSWRNAWGRPGLPFILPEPNAKHARSEQITVSLEKAVILPNARKAPKPATFLEQKSEPYWQTIASAAKDFPKEDPAPAPIQVAWAKAVPLKMEEAPTRRALETPSIFGDNMVLQAGLPVKVWGWAEPGETVSVTVAGQTQEAQANEHDRWEVIFPPIQATDAPQTMTVKTKTETLTFGNVLVGEVWLNSGQSNAGFGMKSTLGFDEEKPKANHPTIRYFLSTRTSAMLPNHSNIGKWVVVTPDTVGMMSGISYYFARSIQNELHVPVGMIESSHGGSTIISWMSETALASSPKFAALMADLAKIRDEYSNNLPLIQKSLKLWADDAAKNAEMGRPVFPFPIDAHSLRPFYSFNVQNPMSRRGSMFYNGMIYPTMGYSLRGVLWDQGEADGGKTDIYDDLMNAMVADWRKSWGLDFPFYYVQMPARKGDGGLCNMWDAQTRALAKIPKSGLIVSNDLSEPGTKYEVHPRDKKNVGERFARLALSRTYGVKGIVDSSPMMLSVAREANRVAVTFSTPGEGLKTRDGKPSDSWEIAGTDGKYMPATAEISGATVTVSAVGVTEPASVRLGWKSDSNCNLVNSAGLPALPFQATIGK